MDAVTQFSTASLASRIRSNTGWTSMDAVTRRLLELQNRCPASLAMSGDGSFPSRPRHFQFEPDIAGGLFSPMTVISPPTERSFCSNACSNAEQRFTNPVAAEEPSHRGPIAGHPHASGSSNPITAVPVIAYQMSLAVWLIVKASSLLLSRPARPQLGSGARWWRRRRSVGSQSS